MQSTIIRNILKAALVPAMIGIAGLSVTTANATVVLDQSQTNGDFVHFLDADDRIGQSFTVSMAGVLDHIDVHLRKTFPAQGPETDYDIELSLQGLSGGVPDGTSLASVTIDGSLLPAAGASPSPFTTFDLSSFAINVLAGDTFAFVLTGLGGSSTADWNVFTSGGGLDPYAGGAKFFMNGVIPLEDDDDLQFQTFVAETEEPTEEPTEVPEPASLALLGLGLAGLAAMRRRKRMI